MLNVNKSQIKIAQNMVIFGLENIIYLLVYDCTYVPQYVKKILEPLPTNDYPVLNTRLFFECWLAYSLDKSLTSMRDLFKRLNNTGFDVDISTFSKASSHRSLKPIQEIYQKLNKSVNEKQTKSKKINYDICPIDSTIITFTSKLLWILGYHQVKLFSSLNLSTGTFEDNFIKFGDDHDYKYGLGIMSNLPSNTVAVMDRGFAGLQFIQQLVIDNKFFVLRISNSWKLEFAQNTELVKVGTLKNAG
jgi:putative transposase